LQRRGPAAAQELASWRLCLAPGEHAGYSSKDEETVLVLQEGTGTLEAGGRRWDVSRKGVFTERATALYIPRGVALRVEAHTRMEAILVSAPAEAGGEPVLVQPQDVVVNPRGRSTYAREVHDIFVHDSAVKRLLVGETFNPPGHWSSYPPHKHDGSDGEPPQGFGYQTLYTAAGESVTHRVRDGDAVLLPYGYHPVAAAPGYRLYYLWALAGEQRRLAVFEDPQHRWIHDSAE
jgi:5-deoxy-glucuronate isomerase